MPIIGPYRFRLRWIFSFLVVGGPILYYNSQR